MNDEEVFEAARGLVEDQRVEFLANCDPEQVRRVKALLDADITPDSLLDTTAMHMETEEKSQLAMPKRLGDFEILRELGRGGMGVVYEARQKSLKRTVALKVLGSGLGLSSKAILRFRREAEAAGKLHHTNIVPVYTTGEDRGIHFYAMELIDGPSLDQVIKERCRLELSSDESHAETADRCIDSQHYSVSIHNEAASQDLASQSAATISTSSGSSYLDELATMIADVAEALDHAHEHGVVHRDIKPSNLLLGPDGRLSINDFGLARMLEQPGMTVSGEFVGSPLYMSPEQITAGRVAIDHRTDIYSLGATLYELLTGHPPFPGQSRDQVLSQILHKEPSSPRKLDRKVPVDLDTICMKAIDKDPDRRYQTAGQLADDLRKYVNRYAISARRVGVIAKSLKILQRNKVSSLAVCSAILVLVLSLGLVLRQRQAERDKKLEATIDGIYEKVFIYQADDVPRLVDLAQSLGATDEQMYLLRGLEEKSRNDYEGAMEWFGKLLDKSLSARALYANAMFWSGTEVGYMNELRKLEKEIPSTFEEKLFLGVANIWGNPKEAYIQLKMLNERRQSLQYVKTQLAEAARILATLVEDDLKVAERLLEEAHNLTGTLQGQTSVETEGTRILLLVDQARLYERRSELADTRAERAIYEAKLLSKKSELEQFVAKSLRRLEDGVKTRAFAVGHALLFLGREMELEQLAADWWKRREQLQAFTAHFLAIHFASKGDFATARNWFFRVSNSGDEFTATQFIPALMDALDTDSARELEGIRIELRSECKRKVQSTDASGLLYFDAMILYLLGDDEFLQKLEEDRLLTQLHGRGNIDPIVNYFKKASREPSDAEKLLLECETTNSPNLSTMHARFALGIESLVNAQPQQARIHFEHCANGRQYIWYVNRLSKALLNQEESWKRFSELSPVHTQ